MQINFQPSRNGWHAKLMNFIWGLNACDFNWWCPYFWLTAFNIIFFPAIMVSKFLLWNIEKFSIYFDKQEQKYYQKLFLKLKNDPVEYDSFIKLKKFKYNSRLDQFMRYLYEQDYEFYSTLNDKRSELLDFQYRKLKKEMISKENILKQTPVYKIKFVKIYQLIKPITTVVVYIIMSFLILLACYLLYSFGVYLTTVSHKVWITTIQAILIFLSTMCILILIIYGKIKFIESDWSKKTKSNISHFFKTIFNAIKSFFQFIGIMISDSCPAIKWKD